MARSPYQGNFQPNVRPTVVTAPDALVFINGEPDLLGCPSCKRKFDLSKYITQIQVNLDVDSVPGSATINLSVPRHIVDDFFFDGIPIISPMMEVEIFGKGYFLLEGVPQYYPIFWGIVTEVSESYSSGEHSVTINCADILKWWDICRLNVNPAFLGSNPQLGKSIFGNVLFGTNPYDVIYTLSQMAFGDVLVATGSLISRRQENSQKSTFNPALSDIMAYWARRFTKIRSNLLLYGVSGVAVRGSTLYERYQAGKLSGGVKNFVSSTIREASPGGDSQVSFDPADSQVTAFRTQYGQLGEGVTNLWQNDYQTKLEIANACKEAIGFEFYMDVTGDIVFKPPFYNLDVLSNKPVSWIQDIDIIDWDFTESEAEVVTQLTMQGGMFGNKDYGTTAELTPTTSVTDYHLLRKYGWRAQPYNSEFLGENMQRMFFHGMDVLDRINSRRHQATITIPFRPELRLGFPVYVGPKDQVWYIKGVNHNVSFGGRATTTLSLTARRSKFVAIKGISTLKVKGKDPFGKTSPKNPPTLTEVTNASFELDLGDAGTVPMSDQIDIENPNSMTPYEPLILRHPKTGRIVGFPNAVMVYSRPYKAPTSLKAQAPATGQKAPGTNKQVSTKNQAQVAKNQAENQREQADEFIDQTVQLLNKYAQNRYTYGLNSAGVFTYAYDQSRYITQLSLVPTKNVDVLKEGTPSDILDSKLKSPTTLIRPVSDERGFEVVGHYRYGRGVSLRDGALITNDKGQVSRTGQDPNRPNTGDFQFALSGDLYSSLTAQSQGITSSTSVFPNSADAIARLQPEDLQTATSLVPEQGAPVQFNDVGTSFVDTATLGSTEQKGVPASVEASQLSRALTLAEMTVKFGEVPGDEQCACQTGRADLAWINYGYQTGNNITTSSPDIDASVTEALAAYDAASATQPTVTVADALASFDAAHPQSDAVANIVNPAVATLTAGLSGVNLAAAATGTTASTSLDVDTLLKGVDGRPIDPSKKGVVDTITRVESYLWDLYSALDQAHHQTENALRGDPDGLEPDEAVLPDLFSTPVDQSSAGFAPPFAASNRSGLGDPRATALNASSAEKDLSTKFKNFGEDLRYNTLSKKLSTELTNLTSKANRLRARIAQKQNHKGSTLVGSGDLSQLQKELAKIELDISQKEGELSQLTAEHEQRTVR